MVTLNCAFSVITCLFVAKLVHRVAVDFTVRVTGQVIGTRGVYVVI